MLRKYSKYFSLKSVLNHPKYLFLFSLRVYEYQKAIYRQRRNASDVSPMAARV